MKKKEEVKRKTRSDKKREIRPTISSELHECISRLSYITSTPMKRISSTIIFNALNNHDLMDTLSQHFRRDYWFNEAILMRGHYDRIPYRYIRKTGGKVRTGIKFSQPVHDKICDLAYALSMTPSSATGLLLEYAIKKTDIVHNYITFHVKEALDPNRLKQLKEVKRFVEENSPFEEEVTIAMLLEQLVDELRDTSRTFKDAISDWLDERK